MKYAVLADIHYGSNHHKNSIDSLIKELRDSGYTIVFAGDIFDLWRDEKSPVKYSDAVHKGDIYLQGNHDFGYVPPEGVLFYPDGISLRSGNKTIFITHGDEIDFIHGFAMAELGSKGMGPLWLRLIGKIRKWQAEDVSDFYRAMDKMPDWALESLEHGGRNYLQRFKALTIAVALCLAEFKRPNGERFSEAVEVDATIINQEPEIMYERICMYRPAALFADHIIIGHIHRPRTLVLSNDTKLSVLGAWVEGVQSTYITIEDGEVIEHLFDDSL